MARLRWWERLLARVPAIRRELAAQDKRVAKTERVRQRAIRARVSLEQVRSDYLAYGRSMENGK